MNLIQRIQLPLPLTVLVRGPLGLSLAAASLALLFLGCAHSPADESVGRSRSASAGGLNSAAIMLNGPVVAPSSKKGWVEVDAAVLAGDDESPAAARRRAVNRARQAAVEYVAGVQVRSSVVTLDQVAGGVASDLLQSLTATQSDAMVVDEELLDSQIMMSAEGGYQVSVKLAARVLNHKSGSAADFETEVRLNRTEYRAGDRVELAVRVSEDARIYVLGVSEAGAVVLLPNRHLPDTRVEADTWLNFPGDELASRGVALEAQLSKGRLRSQEALIVVALRGRRRLESELPASGEIFASAEGSQAMKLASDFLSPLVSIPASEWTFDQVVYSISQD